MTTKERRKEFLGWCERWSWNASPAEIAKELIDQDMNEDDEDWEALEAVFKKYFKDTGEQSWDVIEDIVRTFS